jgi:SAM-dependent methyltransferase
MHETARNHTEASSLVRQSNFLDRLSTRERFAHYYAGFVSTERALVTENIRRIIPRGRILNAGCGGNGVERSLFPLPDYKIVGVDINAENLQVLHAKRLYDGLYNANIVALPFRQGSFDIVYLRLVLHHLVYPANLLAEGLQECFRMLRSGGILTLVEPNSWHPIGALMNLAHKLGVDSHIHGTNDDVALSPLALHRILAPYCLNVSTHAISYSWRRLPIPLQVCVDGIHSRLDVLSKVPYLGHTLMMIACKR